MKKLTLGLSAAALALAGTVAIAQSHDMDKMGPGMMDPMAGKTVTKAEAMAMAAQMFDKMDANHDGKLDTADREAHRAQMMGQMFDKLDTDKNGSISREEFMAGHAKGPEGDHAGMRMGHGGHGGMGGGMGGGMMMMRMADTNKDGAVSKDEFMAAATRHFDMADANHDGKLTPDERKAAHEKMRGMMGKMKQMRGEHGGMPGMDMPPPPPGN